MSSEQTTEQKVCPFYSRKKWCKFGNRCRFLHIRENTVEETVKKSESCSDQTAGKTEDTQTDKKTTDSSTKKIQNDELNKSKVRASEEGSAVAKTASQPCRFYSRNKKCWFGRNCQFLHIAPDAPSKHKHGSEKQEKNEGNKTTTEDDTVHTQDTDIEGGDDRDNPNPAPSTNAKQRLCRYFKKGRCVLGDRCRYKHPACDVLEKVGDDTGVKEGIGSHGSKQTKVPQAVKPVKRPVLIFENLTDEELKKLRSTEISQLLKRFPKRVVVEKDVKYRIVFRPSDPDWPFDIREVEMVLVFPKHYPKELFTVEVPLYQVLPETVVRFVDASIKDWLKAKRENFEKTGIVELAFRPFLRWFDRSLMDTFTQGLKQMKREIIATNAGFEFIPAHQLKPSSADPDSTEDQKENIAPNEVAAYQLSKTEDSVVYEPECRKLDNEEELTNDSTVQGSRTGQGSNVTDPVRKGTEIKFQGLQLLNGAATLRGTKIKITVQCSRCKTRSDLKTPADRCNIIQCSKCCTNQVITWRPAMMHQMASIFGYLDLDQCTPFDLILSECDFMVGCMECSKEMKLQGLAPGSPKDSWCQYCHEKMRLAIETVKFYQLQPSDVLASGSDVHVVAVKRTRASKDLAVQLGCPLPDKGTCKHYKKSFRWLRFPCCGKCYPCDVCHDETEASDHEMKFATRMLCGFCAKEQPYSKDKPCIACNSAVTKGSSSHWEGGKGCRDVIKRSRGDDKKYTSIHKTQSKKAQQKTQASKNKNTKLRHV